MKKSIFLLFLVLLSWQCNQQQHQIIAEASSAPVLLITSDNGKKVPLKLSDLNISVEIVGNIVMTTMDMKFFNGSNRDLEGQLNFPLENEQVVSRFAMDINGTLREGVVVEKEKGRRTFETIVRKNVDPGLLEMTKGNNFRARVYPIPANGHKRIVIGYEEELDVEKKNWLYNLAMGFDNEVDNFNISIDVKEHHAKPNTEGQFSNLDFKKLLPRHFKMAFQAQDYLPNEKITIKIPISNKQPHTVLLQQLDNQYYFYINTLINPVKKKAKLPKSVTLLWDVSNSSQKKEVKKELEALDIYFSKIKKLDVTLVTFSNEVHSSKQYSIKNGNWKALEKDLKNLKYDGGTQIGSIDLQQFPSKQIILSSDGLTTLGKDELTFNQTPIIVFNSNTTSNKTYLKYLAKATAGKYIDFTHQSIDKIKEELFNETYQFISATFDKNVISQTYPSISTPVQEQFSLSGISNSLSSVITLNFGINGQVLHQERINIQGTPEGFDVERLWAKKKVSELNFQQKRHEEEITNLGKKYSLVTPYTSLIVLETLEDYIQYEIEPPAELLKEYKERMAIIEQEEKEAIAFKNQKLEKYSDQIARWWNKNKNVKNEKDVQTIITDHSISGDNLPSFSYSTTTGNATPQDADGTSEGIATNSRGDINVTAENNSSLEYSIDGGANSQGSNGFTDLNSGSYEVETNNENNSPVDQDLLVMEQIDEIQQEIPRTAPPPPPPPVIEEVPDEEVEEEIEAEPSNIVTDSSQIQTHGYNNNSSSSKSSIAIEQQKGAEAYISVLKKVAKKDRYKTYLDLKEEHQNTVTFFLEISTFFLEKGDQANAMRILSNIAEMDLENREFLKILANKYRQMGEYDLAILLLEEIIRIKGEEPQAHRDLGLAYLEIGEYQKSLDLLYLVVSKDWEENEGRFEGIKEITFTEMNNLIALHANQLDLSDIPKNWIRNLPVDIRIVLNWSSDATDVDLWVIEPTNEKCFYSNKQTKIGGRISFDMTRGYGPEEYLLRKAPKGKYTVIANYFGDTRQNMRGNVTVDAQVFTNYGRSNQKMKEMTLTLRGVKEEVLVGSIEFE